MFKFKLVLNETGLMITRDVYEFTGSSMSSVINLYCFYRGDLLCLKSKKKV